MKKVLWAITISFMFFANIVNAQYSEVWNSVSGNSFIGAENMDSDAAKEIVYLGLNPYTFYIIDGNSGVVEWQSEVLYDIGHGSTTNGDYNPKLIDVNNNGQFELLFYGKLFYEDNSKVHLFAFGGNLKVVESRLKNDNQILNYPNPFIKTTTIKYAVPENGSHVTIVIYDSNGNVLKTIVNERKNVGEYEILFNGYDLSSGVYYYQVNIGNERGTKKMIKME
jgi:hypothetical protein